VLTVCSIAAVWVFTPSGNGSYIRPYTMPGIPVDSSYGATIELQEFGRKGLWSVSFKVSY